MQAFRDACVYAASIASADAAPAQIHEAIAAAYGERGVALLNIPQDVFEAQDLEAALSTATLRPRPEVAPADGRPRCRRRADRRGEDVTLFVGHGGKTAKAEVLALADKLGARSSTPTARSTMFAFDDAARRRRPRPDRLEGRLRRGARAATCW